MDSLRNEKVVDYLQTFTELNVDFIAYESRVFTFDRVKTIPSLYSFAGGAAGKEACSYELRLTARQLASVCLTMDERPYIRYWAGGSGVSKVLAQLVDAELKKLTGLEWTPSTERERGTLLITDRAYDPVAPVMHEFTYQAMVNDLLPVNGELLTLKGDGKEGEKKDGASDIVLSEDDQLWSEFRHEHIANVLKNVTKQFVDFKNENKMAQLQMSGGDDSKASVSDMVAAMKQMPQYKAMINKYHKHLSIAAECMEVFKKNTYTLKALGELEQDMATGLNENGGKVSAKGVTNALISKCQSPTTGVVEKLRLLMVYLASQGGLGESTRDSLMQGVDTRLQAAIRNLSKLGVNLGKDAKGMQHSSERIADFTHRAKDIPLALLRFAPLLQLTIEQAATDTLSKSTFPYLDDQPDGKKKNNRRRNKANVRSARKQRSNWRPGAKDEDAADTTPRLIVFMAGGVTFSEMRAAYETSARHDSFNVHIGSQSSLAPDDYIRALADLDENDTLTGAAPPKVRLAGGATYSQGSSSAASARARKIVRSDDSDDEPDMKIDFDSIKIDL
jgi:hypothetical protein